jgi:hypothetical protein
MELSGLHSHPESVQDGVALLATALAYPGRAVTRALYAATLSDTDTP